MKLFLQILALGIVSVLSYYGGKLVWGLLDVEQQQDMITKVSQAQNKVSELSDSMPWSGSKEVNEPNQSIKPNGQMKDERNECACPSGNSADSRFQASFDGNYTINNEGSTPAEKVLGDISSPVKGLRYELNKVITRKNGDIVVSWKIHNNTGSYVMLTEDLKKKLSPEDLRVVDFINRRLFRLQYRSGTNLAMANCFTSEYIPPHGRITCSGIYGPEFSEGPTLEGDRVLVYFPGSREPIPFYLGIDQENAPAPPK